MEDGSSNPTEWCMIGRLSTMQFIGKEVIFYGAGCHLYFINMVTKEHSFYKANNAMCGDGIRYYAGHRSLNFFCFAENCGNPSIFVMSYPKFEIISILEGGSKEGYIAMAFSECSVLVSLGSLPYFNLTVWNWRRGEKLGSSRSHIHRQKQIIRCNTVNPVRISQLGLKTAKLHIWDILMCGKKCIMTHHKVKMPQEKPAPLVMSYWSPEGMLYALDNDGSAYIINSEYILEKIITHNKMGSKLPSFTMWKGDFVITGPNTEIRFYRRTTNTWSLYNSLTPSEVVEKVKSNKNDILVGLTDRAYLVKIDPENKKYEFIKANETEFHNICMVYPVGQYVCLLSQGNMVSVVEIATGEVVSKYDLMGTALTIAGNPEFPYIGIGYINGILELLSIYDSSKLATMAHFNLTTNQISSVYFSEFGRVMVAADIAVGEFFVLEGIPGGHIQVVATVSTSLQVADYMLVPSTNCYRLFVIPVTSNEYIKGNKVIRYCIMDNHQINVKEYHFPDQTKEYSRILSTAKINRDRVFYVMPFNSKYIEEVETRRGDNMIRILNTFETGHQVRRNGFYIDKYHAVTWSYDGFIIARTADMGKVIGHALPHHRRNGGVKKAYIDPLGKYIVSLGNDNIVACTNLINNEPDYGMQEDLIKLLNSNRYALLFQRKTKGFDPGPTMRDYTWLEVDKMRRTEHERKAFQEEKAAIYVEYNEIRNKLRALLNQNLEGPENEKLDLVEFNLDTKYFDEIKEKNRVECKDTEQYIKKYVAAIYRVCDNIKNLCYNTMAVQKRKILGLGSSLNVESYSLLPPEGKKMEELNWIMEQLKLERFVNENDTFTPWKPMTQTERKHFLDQPPQVPVVKKKQIEDLEEEVESVTVDKETIIAMAGSTAQNFIEISPYKYNQLETQTFYQLQLISAVTNNDTVKLREYFNKEFENLMQQKTREMGQIKEKNQRLRYIVDEINYFSTEQIYICITDPVWTAFENIETLVTIQDSQVPIPPYISPSEQAILDAKAAEAERIRLLLLADDFRERALMAMMNGVLEVRWEDELKKDVPLPKCMIEKQPEEFNEDDLRAVKDYEEKVKFLNSERERYKNILDQEYTRITSQIRESVRKFDSRMNELLHLRIKVDEAIIQEVLILCKERLKLLDLMAYAEKELELKKIMVGNEELIRSVDNLINSLQESVMECRNSIEAIQNREKFLDKNLKKDMSEFNQVIQEASVKLLKRRPKVTYKNIMSSTMLQALARAVITKDRPPTLLDECIEYLNALDNLDHFVGVPPTVDEEAYAVICKHRRLRIEHEIKLKSASLALTEAEATVAILQKRLYQKKEVNVRSMADLAQVRTDRLKRLKNVQMQIVLKQGFVEVPMHGNISDFQDAILISRKEVEDINTLILENGRIKLNTMRHTMTFHREIMKMEWTHKKLRMHIEDLNEELNDINHLKVTKEMQVYLKGKEKSLPFEVGLELLKNSYEIILTEKKVAVGKLKKMINVLREDSRKLDAQIRDINVDVCECKLDKDWELDVEAKKQTDKRMQSMAKRSKMIRKIQENHQTILLLQTELELLRLKTYPTIKYRILS
ncbi:cilia- and flagella-associated protein 43 [Coccinella septempunctata]|uniref:cilia- and flagella-associated protein 43 n=1 Tax=Coccinella septempunctata TaxID=41139 RepID=UPI001D078496|nr:cilia- and flagella-associated protein 43 [Coccinella septempunctata]